MMKLPIACGLALSAAVAAYSSLSVAAPTAATAAAPAAATVAPAAATASSKPAAAPKLICESVNEMGSHMKKRVCLTPEQMAQRHRDSQQAAQDLQNRATPVNANGKPPI